MATRRLSVFSKITDPKETALDNLADDMSPKSVNELKQFEYEERRIVEDILTEKSDGDKKKMSFKQITYNPELEKEALRSVCLMSATPVRNEVDGYKRNSMRIYSYKPKIPGFSIDTPRLDPRKFTVMIFEKELFIQCWFLDQDLESPITLTKTIIISDYIDMDTIAVRYSPDGTISVYGDYLREDSIQSFSDLSDPLDDILNPFRVSY